MSEERISVLVVDDNREFCEIIGDYFEDKEDIRLAGVAHDGNEAVRLISELTPDVVLLDIIMPHLDGIGVLEKMSSINLSKRPKVIMLTALGHETITRRAIDMGADYYVMKPFDLETLVQRIRQLSGSQDILNDISKTFNKRKRVQSSDLTAEITRLMHQMGIPANIKGYAYLREAILIAVDEVHVLNNITKNLYPRVAQKFNTTGPRVERAIRHAIEIAWERGNIEFLDKLFGHSLDLEHGRPTNSAFIARLSDKIRLEQNLF